MSKGITRRGFLLGSGAALASAAALFGVSGCDTGAGGTAASKGMATNGVVDVTQACTGQDTYGLATLEEAIGYNQITTDASEKQKQPTIIQDMVPYLHTTDYGKPVDLMIELLTPSTANKEETPLLVWFNGGGFTSCDPTGHLDLRLPFAKAGYVVASVQYRTGTTTNFPAPLQDVKAAIRFLKARADTFKFNPKYVTAAGNSAGGYYASMVGVTSNLKTIPWPDKSGAVKDVPLDVGADLDQSSAVNAVLDYYGVSDLTLIGSGLADDIQQGHHSAATTEAILLNGAAAAQKGVGVFDSSMEQKVSAASPLSYIGRDTPPFIFFHGTTDTLVSPVSTKMMQKRLDDAGVATQRIVIDGAGHGADEFGYPDIVNAALAFMDKYAHTPVMSKAPTVDYSKGTRAYEAADLPTLDEANAGAQAVTADSGSWTVNQVRNISYKVVAKKYAYSTLKMNLLIPSQGKDTAPRPVLYCGACGGFNKSNPDVLQYLRFAERGYAVAVAEIRVVTASKMPEPLQDAKAGVRWLRAHAKEYNLDPDCIIATGSSAGGYVGVMLGVLGNTTQYSDDVKFDVGDNLDQSSSVQGVVDYYGVSDLTIIGAGLPNYDVHDSESNTEALWVNGTAFGANPGGSVFSDTDKTAIFSPFTYLDKNDPPFLMFHGTDDVVVSPIATMELYNRCKKLGIDAERYSFVGAGHGDWQMKTDHANQIVDDFMDKIVASHSSGK